MKEKIIKWIILGGVIISLSIIGTCTYIHIKNDGEIIVFTAATEAKLNALSGIADNEILKMKETLDKMTKPALIDSLQKLIKQREYERDEFRRLANEFKNAAKIENEKERNIAIEQAKKALDNFFKNNPNAHSSDYYEKATKKWYNEDKETEVTGLRIEMETLIKKNAELKLIVEKLMNELKTIKEKAAHQEIEIGELKSTIKAKENEIEQLEKNDAIKNETIQNLKQQLTEIKQQLEKYPPVKIKYCEFIPTYKKGDIVYETDKKKGNYKLSKIKDLKLTIYLEENYIIVDDMPFLTLIYEIPTTHQRGYMPMYRTIDVSKQRTLTDIVTENDIKQEMNKQNYKDCKLLSKPFVVTIRYRNLKNTIDQELYKVQFDVK